MSETTTAGSSRFTAEGVLYALAVAAALAVRLWGLGRAPLGENEARLALQALEVAARHPTPLGDAPLLTGLTGLAFFLLGSTDAVARLVPALLGGLLPLLAWPLRKPLGRRAALLLAFALAFDPGLVALSRAADSPVPAVLALSAAVLAAAHARWDWALPLTLLGLLLGPSFWFGVLTVLLALALYRVMGFSLTLALPPDRLRAGIRRSLVVAAVGSTLAFWMPEGLGAWFNGLSAFIHTLVPLAPVPVRVLVVALIAYAPLATGAAIGGAALLWKRRQPTATFALATALSALMLAVLYPGRSVPVLVWALLPLWVVGAWALVQIPLERPADTAWQAALTLALLTFSWLSLLAWSQRPAGSPQAILQLGLVIASLLLVPLLSALLAFSRPRSPHPWRESLLGPTWGLVAAAVLLTVSAFSRAAYGPRPAELWYPAPAPPQLRLLQTTLADLGQQRHGLPNTLEVTLLAPEERLFSLRWLLHDDPNAQVTNALAPNAQPEAILAFANWKPTQTQAYRGQDFPLVLVPPLLPTATLQETIQWMAFRTPRPAGNTVILWVRTDLFPGHAESAP